MRRKTSKDILKENRALMILSALLVVFGIFCAVAPHIVPRVDYDSLQTKDVTVAALERYRVRTITGYRLYTTDGEKYNISGDYRRSELEELVTEGKKATIRYCENKPFRTVLIKEMDVDGVRVVTYDPDKPVAWRLPLILGVCFASVGAGGFLFLRFIVKTNRKRQKARDERIRKKYGSAEK